MRIKPKVRTKFRIKAEFILPVSLFLLKLINLYYINFNRVKSNKIFLENFFLGLKKVFFK